MPRLRNIETKVIKILEEYPETRGDDWLLLRAFYNEIIDVSTMSFATVCQHHEDLKLPSFESIRRCRQKVQANRLDLVDPRTAKHRRKLVDEYKEYAKV